MLRLFLNLKRRFWLAHWYLAHHRDEVLVAQAAFREALRVEQQIELLDGPLYS